MNFDKPSLVFYAGSWRDLSHTRRTGFLLKKACVELGGKDVLIVLDDANFNK